MPSVSREKGSEAGNVHVRRLQGFRDKEKAQHADAGARTGWNASPSHPCVLRTRTPPLAHASSISPAAGARARFRAGASLPARARPRSLSTRAYPGAGAQAAGGTLGTRRRGAGLPGRGQGGGESRSCPEPRRVFPAPGSGRCKLHLVDFLHPGPRVHRLSPVVTLSPEGCLTSHPPQDLKLPGGRGCAGWTTRVRGNRGLWVLW